MSKKAFETIISVGEQLQTLAGHLQSTNPPVASAMIGLSGSVRALGNDMEVARIQSIIEGNHEALLPVRHLLHLQGQHQYKFAMENLMGVNDEPIGSRNTTSAMELLLQRFIGVVYRRIYAQHGIEENVLARRLFMAKPGCQINGYYIKDFDLVFDFKDVAQFRHSLTFGHFFGQQRTNTYNVHSLWMDETFALEFCSIGKRWMETNIIDQLSAGYNILEEEWKPLDIEDLIVQINAIEDVGGLCMFHSMTMQYPGDAQQCLPAGRFDVSYHYYAGSESHRLVANFYSDEDRYLIGLNPAGSHHLTFDNCPTPLQQWVKDNINDAVIAKLAEIEKERSGDNS